MERALLVVDFNQAGLARIASSPAIPRASAPPPPRERRSTSLVNRTWKLQRARHSRNSKRGPAASLNCRILPVDSKHFVSGFSVNDVVDDDEEIAGYWILPVEGGRGGKFAASRWSGKFRGKWVEDARETRPRARDAACH